MGGEGLIGQEREGEGGGRTKQEKDKRGGTGLMVAAQINNYVMFRD